MKDNKIIYQSSKSKSELKEPTPSSAGRSARILSGTKGRSFMRFALSSFAILFIITLLSGCGSSRMQSLQRDRLEREALAREQALIEYGDPERNQKHDKRKRRFSRREKRRLKALEEQKEIDAELAAEQWWIERELLALLNADEQREIDNEKVRRWREKEEKIKKEEEAEALRLAAPKTLEERVFDTLGMVYIRGGCFEVNDDTSANSAKKESEREVCVDDFYMGKHEITAGEFRKFVDETKYLTDAERDGGCYLYTGNTWYKTTGWKKKNLYNWRDISFNQDSDHPVACVSWDDANEFVKWKSNKHGIKYRLPTEAEWEYAASGGDHREKWSGTNEEKDIGIYAWHFNNSNSRTHPVGQKKPNKLGLFDMSGNVWEWVQDNYDHNENAVTRSDKKLRVIRGGSWYSIHTNLSTDKRFKHLKPNYRDFASGFRLGMDGRIKLNKASSLR